MQKRFKKYDRFGFTLTEMMIVVGIVGMLAVIAVPSYVKARERSHVSICLNNLRNIDGAKAQYAMDARLSTGDDVPDNELDPYLKPVFAQMEEPSGGNYTVNKVGTDPICSIGGEHEL
jgi:prepilin-type N-terminal cleavage/methylation domain-containing protein